MSVGDLYRLTLLSSYTRTGTEVNNVLHFVELNDHGDFGAGYLATHWMVNHATWLTTAYRNRLINAYAFEAVRVQRLFPTRDTPVVVASSPVIAGTNDTLCMPAFATMNLQISGERAGRSGSGRLYLGGFNARGSLDDGNDGLWSSNYTNDVLAGWNAHRLHFRDGVADWMWVVYSAKLGGRHPYSSLGATPVLSLDIDQVIRLQRSRELGVSRRHAGRH